MGLIHIEMFATLDLVGQAPGAPDEDPVGFEFGGWQAPFVDEATGAQIAAAYEDTDALLLGRRTYDIFAAFWPHQEGGTGKKVFDDGAVPANLTLLEPPVASAAGTVYLRYGLADGIPETGDVSAADR